MARVPGKQSIVWKMNEKYATHGSLKLEHGSLILEHGSLILEHGSLILEHGS